jgi:hypothetical protein
MEFYEREYFVLKILSGLHRVSVGGRFFCVKSNTIEDKYRASEIYRNIILSKPDDIYDEETIEDYLIENGYWSNSLAQRLKTVEKEIENTLVLLFQNRTNKSIQKRNRPKLAEYREERMELLGKRHGHDDRTIEYVATLAKQKFLVGSALYENDKKYWSSYDDWNKPDDLLEKIVNQLNKETIPYNTYRELARTEPWRGIWVAKKSGCPIFPFPAYELTEGQQLLISWSVRYENLYQHPECPPDSVIEDDDLLDGWYIVQSRKDKEEKNEGVLGKVKNQSIRNSHQVFIKADNQDEIDEILDLNKGLSKAEVKRMDKELEEKGELNEHEFSDFKKRREMMANAAARRS